MTVTSFKGIAAVTQTLGYLAGNAARMAVPEAGVTLDPPEAQPAAAQDSPRLNIYLVQVSAEPTMRSAGLPERDAAGQVVAPPQAALRLFYLFSFFGPNPSAQMMLGAVELALRERAVFDGTLVEQATSSHPELAGHGVDLQTPPVRVTPSTITLEGLSRFWSGFFQMPYTLSTLYEASPVLLTSSLPAVAPGLPTLTVDVSAQRMSPVLDPPPPVTFAPGASVPLTGRGLSPGMQLWIGNTWVPIEAAPAGGLVAALPPTVAAGVTSVTLGAGTPAAPIPGAVPQPLVIRPAVDSVTLDATTGDVAVRVRPSLGPDQSAVLTLVNLAGTDDPPASARIGPPNGGTASRLVFTAPSLPPGPYLALLEVDGVSSAPGVVNGRYARPQVQLR